MEQVFDIMEQVDEEFFLAAVGAFSAIGDHWLEEANQADAMGAYIGGGPL